MIAPTLYDVFEQPELNTASSPLFSPADMEKSASLAAAESVDATRHFVDSLLSGAAHQLLDVSLTGIMLGAWKKLRELREYASGEKLASDETHKFELTEHRISSKHSPKIELFVHDNKIGEVVIDVTLSLLVARSTLLIRKGRIMEARLTGCQAGGKISCHGQTLVEKKLRELEFPLSLSFGDDGVAIPPPLKLKQG